MAEQQQHLFFFLTCECAYVYSHLDVDACMGVCQRSTSHSVPQVLSTLLLEIGSPTGAELAD